MNKLRDFVKLLNQSTEHLQAHSTWSISYYNSIVTHYVGGAPLSPYNHDYCITLATKILWREWNTRERGAAWPTIKK